MKESSCSKKSVETLPSRFRQIDLEVAEKPSAPEIKDWSHWEAAARRGSFVDTVYDAEATTAQVGVLFPEANLPVSPMFLREIYLWKLGEMRKEQAERREREARDLAA